MKVTIWVKKRLCLHCQYRYRCILAIQTATASAQVAGVGTRKKNVEQKFIMEKYTNFLEKNCTYFICDKNELSL